MVTPALPTDPLWPRAGDWPGDVAGAIDLALVGIPTWRTSLSPTSAHATPAAVRAALRRFTPFAATSGGQNVDGLILADFGDAVEPDGPDGEPAAGWLMADAVARSRMTVALGG